MPKGAPSRRVVRLINADCALASGVALFVAQSFTAHKADDAYELAVDLETGKAVCDCPHFNCRLNKLNPTCYSPKKHLCKHLRRAIRNLHRRKLLRPEGELYLEDRCMHCGGQPDHAVCDLYGRVLDGQFICSNCVHRLRFEAQMRERELTNSFRNQHYEHFSTHSTNPQTFSDPDFRQATRRQR